MHRSTETWGPNAEAQTLKLFLSVSLLIHYLKGLYLLKIRGLGENSLVLRIVFGENFMNR